MRQTRANIASAARSEAGGIMAQAWQEIIYADRG
jgi:hypothetical protein